MNLAIFQIGHFILSIVNIRIRIKNKNKILIQSTYKILSESNNLTITSRENKKGHGKWQGRAGEGRGLGGAGRARRQGGRGGGVTGRVQLSKSMFFLIRSIFCVAFPIIKAVRWSLIRANTEW